MDHAEPGAHPSVQPVKQIHRRDDQAWEQEALRLWIAAPDVARLILWIWTDPGRDHHTRTYRFNQLRTAASPAVNALLLLNLPVSQYTLRKLGYVLGALQREREKGVIPRWRRPQSKQRRRRCKRKP